MIFDKIREALADQLEIDPEKITMTTDVVADLGADSLDVAELIMVLEEEYNVSISDEEIHGLRTVGDVVALMERLTSKK